ncbi:Fic/DOC family protein [Marihabitans asiaticum]|uniref:Fic/DOC family protein n=1 Tax=Marihabitans asiaticum TaxID=415218 RepID=A0A560WDW4_9MICO|nr:Fic family protein [Marihabitans asiaticum]TWD15720.1 Fic/DOC family protein [Marihabitans asiaticum]
MSSPLVTSLRTLADLPDVTEASEAAREACTSLRWHEGLRRRTAEAAAESRVRGAWASAELDGARSSATIVRALMIGSRERSLDPDPAERVIHGAIAATAETEHLRAAVVSAPGQVLARLHTVAAAELVEHPDQLGRPRVEGEGCGELSDLGEPPERGELRARLTGILDLMAVAGEVPALVAAAVVHAEILAVRPFTTGNGLVARAVERLLVQALGLDPTGVAVPEAGHGAEGGPAYLGSAAGYVHGGPDGVRLWLRHCGAAVVAGAGEGVLVADSVRAGRLR